jgi:hypothetical protein
MDARQVAILYARADSVYKTLPGCDVWDEERDARRWPGGAPVVAHPPCRAWGKLRKFANPMPHEKDLARLSVAHVRRYGGVLEHPEWSTLWDDMGLPRPANGLRDEFGGWTLAVSQKWWGHRAEKKTWLYIVGCEPRNLPPIPYTIAEATHVIKGVKGGKPAVSKAEREHTPPDFAVWLVEVARMCDKS